MIKLIVLDFDGVIVESADIKTEAYRKLFSDYPSHVDEIVEYHKKNAGINRYEKFEYIFKNILRQPLSEKKKAELGRRFSVLVVDAIKTCPLVPGAFDFLEKYSKKLKLFIASSTPEEEVHYLVEARDIQKYFCGVYGAPTKKSEIISRIVKEEGAIKDEVLFVGDSAADYKEAKKAGVQFIGRVGNLTDSPFPIGVGIVRDLNELSTLVDCSKGITNA